MNRLAGCNRIGRFRETICVCVCGLHIKQLSIFVMLVSTDLTNYRWRMGDGVWPNHNITVSKLSNNHKWWFFRCNFVICLCIYSLFCFILFWFFRLFSWWWAKHQEDSTRQSIHLTNRNTIKQNEMNRIREKTWKKNTNTHTHTNTTRRSNTKIISKHHSIKESWTMDTNILFEFCIVLSLKKKFIRYNILIVLNLYEPIM